MSDNQTQTEKKADQVFISYSWTTPEHEQWVLNLANMLYEDEVDVVFDKWDLKDGHDIYKYMERSVNDPEIKRVLIVCDKAYMEKANKGTGGVGTEGAIISPEVYGNAEETKFIAILAEVDENGKPYVPTFLRGRKYIDMSTAQKFDDGYAQLIRNLYHKPEYQRPANRKKPAWLLEDEQEHPIKSQRLIIKAQRVFENNPQKSSQVFREFQDAFFEDYKSFSVTIKDPNDLYEVIPETFRKMLPLRNAYISFMDSNVSSV